ncbi:acyl-CoA dehydrogenase family protein [bacterium]|nr:acyl-CoA dehydrogenase family protein [bacterium]
MNERKIFSGGEFLISDVKQGDVFAPEEFTNEQKMVFKAAFDFVKKELADNAEEIEKKDETKVRNWFSMAGELGLNAADIPEEYGGEGMDKISACLVGEAMGGANSFAVSHSCQTGIGSLPIYLFGTEEQKQKYLPKLATGEMIGAYCLTESGAGSDAMNAATTAVLSEDGSHYILNGEKIFITNGAWADVLTVFAKVDGEKFTGFIIEKGFEGFSTGPEESKLGIKGSSTVTVILKDCKVPVENVLFTVGSGHKIAFNVLNIGRYKLGANAMGGAKNSIAAAVKYANERVQFGKKISSFGMIRNKLAQMTIKTYMTESIVYRLAAAIDDKMSTLDEAARKNGEEVAKAIEEYSVECAITKIYGSEALDYVVDELVQIYGGNGYISEFPAERAYRDSRINRIFEGTNEINRLVITGNVLKMAMKGKLALLESVGTAMKDIASYDTSVFKQGSILATQGQILKNSKNLFLLTVNTVTQKLLETLQEDQEVIELLADMVIEIFAMESGLLRAQKFMETKGEKKAELHIAAVKAYCADAILKMAGLSKNVLAFAESGEALEKLITDVDKLAYAPMENTIAQKRLIAEKVIKGKKYPF